MSASKKRTKSGYNAASPRRIANELRGVPPARQLGTATLIFTRSLIHQFGNLFRLELNVESSLLSISDLYEEAIKKALIPVTKSKTVPDFETRAASGFVDYSHRYDAILLECVRTLGESRFKIEFVRQVAEIDKELRGLPFASLDLVDLFRRHVACCTNAAASYEDLFKDMEKLRAVDQMLRKSNYGLTVLVLLFNGTLDGPLWVMRELQRFTTDALSEIESMPEVRATPGKVSGSLIFAEGKLDFSPKSRKAR